MTDLHVISLFYITSFNSFHSFDFCLKQALDG